MRNVSYRKENVCVCVCVDCEARRVYIMCLTSAFEQTSNVF